MAALQAEIHRGEKRIVRDSNAGRRIQQQMYARERRGIFRSTEGYDTIAKSNGLDPNFIKKQLHPFCVYDAPAELAVRGVKDDAAYPETMHLLRLENGDMLLGRSVFRSADFTGLRSAFFTHNYIVPGDDPLKSENDYKAWLRASFADSYDIHEGTELPELTSLPVQTIVPANEGHRSVLEELSIDEKQFKGLLYAVMAAVGGKKKIYVSLDVPIAQLPSKAKQLLAVLYASLPYAYRTQLGFITYAKEPQSRKSVHLTFVEQGSLRVGDRNVEKDFTFDFANNRITNVDLDGIDQPYLDFAWDNLDNPDRTDRFFQFAELMLSGMEPDRGVAASSYHELSVMFQIEEGSEQLYETHKSAVLRGLLDYLKPTDSLNTKIRLNDLMLSRFDYEFDQLMQKKVPEDFVAESIKDFYRIVDKHYANKIVTYFVLAITNANAQSRPDAAASFFKSIEGNPALSEAFFSAVLKERKYAESLFMPYIGEKLGKAPGVKSLLQLLEQWCGVHPQLFNNRPFRVLVCEQLKNKLEREHRSMSAVSKTFEGLDKLEREVKQVKLADAFGAADFYQELALTTYRTLLIELEVDTLTKEQLTGATFLQAKERLKQWNEELHDPRQRSSARVLSSLYEWYTQPKPSKAVFEGLSPAEIDRVQQIGRRLLAEQVETAQFERAVEAFRHSSDVEIVDYVGLIDFIRKNTASKETVYRFFQWSEKHPDFMRSRGFVPAYTSAVIAYFKKYDRDAFKKRANWKQYFDHAGRTLQAVYKQARQELASPLTKFFRGNRKAVVITSITTLGVIIVAIGLLLMLTDKKTPEQEAILPEAQPTENVDPEKEPELETVVYVEQAPAAEGQKAMTSLVFMFSDAATCAAFDPVNLTIVTPDNETTAFRGLSHETNCKTDSGDNAASGDKSGVNDTTTSVPTNSPKGQAESTATPEPSPTPTSNTASSGSGKAAKTDSSPPPAVTGEGNGLDQETSSPPTEKVEYLYKTTIPLGKQAVIPVKSIIRVGEISYEVTEPLSDSAG